MIFWKRNFEKGIFEKGIFGKRNFEKGILKKEF